MSKDINFNFWMVGLELKEFLVQTADVEKVSKQCGGVSVNYIKGIRKQAQDLMHKIKGLETDFEVAKEVQNG